MNTDERRLGFRPHTICVVSGSETSPRGAEMSQPRTLRFLEDFASRKRRLRRSSSSPSIAAERFGDEDEDEDEDEKEDDCTSTTCCREIGAKELSPA